MRYWDELTFREQEEYYHWIITLVDEGKLKLDNHLQVEAKARAMYEADHFKTPQLDPDNLGLDVTFRKYKSL